MLMQNDSELRCDCIFLYTQLGCPNHTRTDKRYETVWNRMKAKQNESIN